MSKTVISLSHSQKIALLKAIQSGSLDLSMFDRADEPQTPREIMAEIVRLEMFGKPRETALLTLDWCDHKITDEEYITKRLEL